MKNTYSKSAKGNSDWEIMKDFAKGGKTEDISLKKGDVIKFKNGERIRIIGRKGDGYDYQDGKEKGYHPKGWFDMMISSGKAEVVYEKGGEIKPIEFTTQRGDREFYETYDKPSKDVKYGENEKDLIEEYYGEVLYEDDMGWWIDDDTVVTNVMRKEYAKGGKLKDWEKSMKERKDIEYLRIERTNALPNGKTMIYYKYNPIGSERYRGTQVGTDSIYAKGGMTEKDRLEEAIKHFEDKIKKQGRITNARDEEQLYKLKQYRKELFVQGGDEIEDERDIIGMEYAKGGVTKGQTLAENFNRKDEVKNVEFWKNDVIVKDKDGKAVRIDLDKGERIELNAKGDKIKSNNNEMIIGGLAGVLFGFFLNR